MARSRTFFGAGGLGALAVLLLFTKSAAAQDCGCDHTIDNKTNNADGQKLGVQAGDVVCVEAGERPFLILENFVGSAAAPIVIKNCGGQVKIANADKGYGLAVNASSFFHLTGTGDSSVEYGFDVSASRTGPDYSGSGVPVGGLSTDYELDHIEVHHTGFAGFILKTESRCDGSANLGNFVQKNTVVHHTFVHDTGGEAFYVGSTGYGGRNFDCNGTQTKLYPHEHDGVSLHDNLIRDTGWDGLQVGVTPKNCEVYRNAIIGVGRTATDPVQTRGIQIGGASACRIYDNYLQDGPTIGIFILGAGNTEVVNNVVVGFGEDGMYANDQQNDAIAGAHYVFLHNTVVRSGDTALSIFGPRTKGNAVVNNLFVASKPYGAGGDVDVTESGNLELDSEAKARFTDASKGDFSITEDSPAHDVGEVVTGFAVDRDRDGVPRDDGKPDVGAYEFTSDPRPGGGAPGSGGGFGVGGSAGSNAAGDGAGDDGGCGCRVHSTSQAPGWLAALALLLPWAARRRRPASRPH